ncbi:LOW QUALITY PROTEIN: Crinkler (CRN) family protein [Phytophthora palmivora]|uniref:Crinkler (CRN) family protein n=1 Tax=Phytophthora palmivora TaxID=4796 RepID=A0A2P4XAM4_9STRA|nr:LOW QUALITY PROTEIN: Crinkler (CRN) family protein [Phytophthora palmivora]
MNPTQYLKNDKHFGTDFQPDEFMLVVVPMLHKPQDSQLVMDISILTSTYSTLNPPPLVAFWKALQAASTEIKADNSFLAIRRWALVSTYNTPHVVIFGNPGIGKTFFAYVILLYLARAGATNKGSRTRILFSHDTVVQGSQQNFVRILNQTTTYYTIVDAAKPVYYPAKTILLTLPRRPILWEFNKLIVGLVWSKQEILKCRELMYLEIPVAIVEDCFRRWGGIARYVLRYGQHDYQQVWLEGAIDGVDLDWQTRECGMEDATDAEELYRLLHFRVSKSFEKKYFVFASEYVQQEVYKRLYKRDKQKVMKFLYILWNWRSCIDNSEAHDDDEYLRERYWDDGESEGDVDTMDVDDVVMEDSTAATRDLGDGVMSIQLPERPLVVFNNDNEILVADTTIYLRPASKNYNSVDAIINLMSCFSTAIILHASTRQIYNFQYQMYRNSKGKNMTLPNYVNVPKIQQFAMEVNSVAGN